MRLGRIVRDYAKSKVFDVLKGGRLKTPMENVLLSLRAQHLFPETLVAVDLFGMYGLWNTRDYARHCSYLEMWEIDPEYSRWARRFFPRAVVETGDSIEAVNSNKLRRKSYNFIVVDNPVAGAFGRNYVEHFDLFPAILRFTDTHSVIVLNVVHSMDGIIYRYRLSREKAREWEIRRREFYQQEQVRDVPVTVMLEHYTRLVTGYELQAGGSFYVPRDECLGFVVVKTSAMGPYVSVSGLSSTGAGAAGGDL